jgi:hypothetical protein
MGERVVTFRVWTNPSSVPPHAPPPWRSTNRGTLVEARTRIRIRLARCAAASQVFACHPTEPQSQSSWDADETEPRLRADQQDQSTLKIRCFLIKLSYVSHTHSAQHVAMMALPRRTRSSLTAVTITISGENHFEHEAAKDRACDPYSIGIGELWTGNRRSGANRDT